MVSGYAPPEMIATATAGYSPRKNTSEDRPFAPGIRRSSKTIFTSALRASASSRSPWLATSIKMASGMRRRSVRAKAPRNIGWSSAMTIVGALTVPPLDESRR